MQMIQSRSNLAAMLGAAALAVMVDARSAEETPRGTPHVEKLVELEPGASIQGMDLAPDGTLYFTVYSQDKVMRLTPAGKLETFADTPLHPQGIAVTRTGVLVSGHVNKPNADSKLSLLERFKGIDGRILVLDGKGQVTRTIPVGADSFPNGITRLDAKRYLVADSLAGVVWQVEPGSGKVVKWLDDPLVRPEPGFPGANGVKVHDGWAYVSNTSKAQIMRVRLGRDKRPRGVAEIFSAAPRVDEISIAKDGTVYAASHQAMTKVSAAGEVSAVFESVAGGSTLMLAPDGRSLFVATDPQLVNGARGPGSILRVWLE